MKILILTPNKNEMCGMYQLAKDLAKELNADIGTRNRNKEDYIWDNLGEYKQAITFLYPMHEIGKEMKEKYNVKWICYDQKIPPVIKLYFPNFWRRQIMKYIAWRNNITMQGADEYWDVTEREQTPRWTEKTNNIVLVYPVGTYNRHFKNSDGSIYALYVGRKTDYKNFDWLWNTMEELKIPFVIPPENCSDEELHTYLSNAKMLVTASIWEGYGRPVMETETLGIPAVAYDVGSHKKHIKKGICVPLDINNLKKSEQLFKETVIEVWQSN